MTEKKKPKGRRSFRNRLQHEKIVFLKAWVKNPRRTGAIAPSSPALGAFICRHVAPKDAGYVVEIGAGTGRLTKSLLKGGVNPEKLFVIEFEKDLCNFLRKTLPSVNVIHGNALELATLLPPEVIGKVHTVISGIPLMNFSEFEKEKLVKSCLHVMNTEGQLLQFTYGLLSPLSSSKWGLTKERLGAVFNNVPPAIVWRYQQNNDVQFNTQSFSSVLGKFYKKCRGVFK